MEKTKIEYLWHDKKRIWGLPISFTNYAISDDRFFEKKGVFNIEESELLLYRVKDISLKRSFWQRLCGVGTITIYSSDTDKSEQIVKNIAHPNEVKELLHRQIEKKKEEKGMGVTEFIQNGPVN
ncbi:MAG TPA: hypothetical protein DCG28_04005 [Lachnospiraceae bacterium]|nr:hypothetical protein [Lachnospiraceae bacterium]